MISSYIQVTSGLHVTSAISPMRLYSGYTKIIYIFHIVNYLYILRQRRVTSRNLNEVTWYQAENQRLKHAKSGM